MSLGSSHDGDQISFVVDFQIPLRTLSRDRNKVMQVIVFIPWNLLGRQEFGIVAWVINRNDRAIRRAEAGAGPNLVFTRSARGADDGLKVKCDEEDESRQAELHGGGRKGVKR